MQIASFVKSKKVAPFFVMLAGVLWAVDALLRTQLTQTISPAGIVFTEHVIGFVILSPLFFKAIPKIRTLNFSDWTVAVLLTLVSSVAGTLLFTEALQLSFATYDFSTPVLLQKLQPVFVILLAKLLLHEKLGMRFLSIVPIALIGSYMVSFGTEGFQLQLAGKELIYILSISAAFCWGFGTILSKKLLGKLSFTEATSLRFLLAIPLSFIVMFLLDQQYNPLTLSVEELTRFIIIGLTTGAGAILVYYYGLRKTPAKIATFAELTFPITSILIAVTALNPYGEADQLNLGQIFGIVILILSIMAISFDQAETKAN